MGYHNRAMNDLQRLQLVGATVRSGFTTMEKAASSSPQQREILEAGWPRPEEGLTKLASLARMLATGMLIEEADQSIAQAMAS